MEFDDDTLEQLGYNKEELNALKKTIKSKQNNPKNYHFTYSLKHIIKAIVIARRSKIVKLTQREADTILRFLRILGHNGRKSPLTRKGKLGNK